MSEPEAAAYRVVMNHERQYSIWPVHRVLAPGWTDQGVRGTKEECLRHIDEVWTDMRPWSLRQRLEA
ncbi:antibiotic synthesis protein MbtH [Sphaerisporangium krabiense]|uniref:MbtH protein n=1 Tax=Sphaerisporangium krabiense TaxID=763782 RepID=A0A7W8Z2L2_9ACTN|nr:MbtH family protein [Sphaerisporangium krabiense]MBB5626225.1 MbtH protein [Sphaerisporangium krabiense]GII66108.1 antibiotic synthesis protein MbtH [Sphaerisporangium krabiense]